MCTSKIFFFQNLAMLCHPGAKASGGESFRPLAAAPTLSPRAQVLSRYLVSAVEGAGQISAEFVPLDIHDFK